MWDLSGPEIKPASPALAGGLFTPEPPGKPLPVYSFFKQPVSLQHRFWLLQNYAWQWLWQLHTKPSSSCLVAGFSAFSIVQSSTTWSLFLKALLIIIFLFLSSNLSLSPKYWMCSFDWVLFQDGSQQDASSFFNLSFLESFCLLHLLLPNLEVWILCLECYLCNSWTLFHLLKKMPGRHTVCAFLWSSVSAFGPSEGKIWICFSNYLIFLFLWVQVSSLGSNTASLNLGQEEAVFKRGTLRTDTPSLAAAAKSLQSCLTLCDPIDGSPPGSAVPGILQARTLEWVAISFSISCWLHTQKSARSLGQSFHLFPIGEDSLLGTALSGQVLQGFLDCWHFQELFFPGFTDCRCSPFSQWEHPYLLTWVGQKNPFLRSCLF